MSDTLGVAQAPGALLGTLLSSDTMADVLVLFRRNPGLIDTVDGIAKRVGTRTQTVAPDILELERLSILQKKTVGKSQVYYLNGEKDAEAQRDVAKYISSLGSKSK